MALTNYSELKTSILNWLGRPGDTLIPTDDLIALFEADASRRLRTHYQEVQTNLTTAAGTASYDLPGDFLAAREVSITSTAPIFVLDYMPPAQLDDMFPWGINGQPFNYTLEGTQIRFGPIPDGVYTIRLEYWQAIPPLADTHSSAASITSFTAGDGYTVGDRLFAIGGEPHENRVVEIDVTDVQAADLYDATGLVIADGGTGYTAGDIAVVAGGTFTTAAQITVDTVDGSGVITAAHITTAGAYSVTPANDASTTGGSGSGASFTLTWTLEVPAGAILAAAIAEAGDYTSTPANPVDVYGGTGTGADFTLTWNTTAGGSNWLLDNYPDAYLFGSLAEAELFLGADNATQRFQLFMQRRDAAYQGIIVQDRKYRTGGAVLQMQTDTGNP